MSTEAKGKKEAGSGKGSKNMTKFDQEIADMKKKIEAIEKIAGGKHEIDFGNQQLSNQTIDLLKQLSARVNHSTHMILQFKRGE